ncbi:MAG: response regulator transcription factor [Duodenibacillus sp.]|nr:response regulator transcription factor [Duodenibacillus sp.]
MYTRPQKILIIDDDVELATLLIDYLSLEGFEAKSAQNGLDGLTMLANDDFDLIVLDVMMPGMSGTETLTKIREKYKTPVLMLTARGDPVDRILGLELGADDYVPKPCTPRELVARMRAILRRTSANDNSSGPVQVGKLSIDLSQRRVTYDGQPIAFTGTELALIEMLARHAGEPVAKADIYPRILGRPLGRYDRAIDVHISSIRHKLAEFAHDDILIESVRGVGYQLVARGAAH